MNREGQPNFMLKVLQTASLLSALALVLASSALASSAPTSPLDSGFRSLYNLDFSEAQRQFSLFEQQHADNPLGPVSEAAGVLFAEFQRLGVLESQFYADDSKFESRKKLSPDPVARKAFDAALNRSESLARVRLEKDPKDHDGMFAMTLAAGLRADYAALIEKRNMASLHYTKDATNWANQLLAVHPECYDAHLASGVSKYIIGSMAAPVRWLLRMGGVGGDKQAGISELQVTAQHGHYLAPFARILLAIAYVRDKNTAKARETLASLQNEFPQNPLFAREIARLETQTKATAK
jgi:hypothetical protein